jgi:hypothetical protein
MKMQTTLAIPILVAFLCLSLPEAQAVSPAPDGGYPGGNTAEGQAALLSLTTGGFNTAVGFLSLRSNATGQLNTAIGAGTLLANTADNNTATGAGALLSNTTGSVNTANGASALLLDTTGTANTATGDGALLSNVIGNNNTAIGAVALSRNIADGNTAVGTLALLNNTTGFLNIALGAGAGQNLTTGSHNIDIGNAGVAGEGNTIRIGDNNQGATFIGAVYGVSVAGLAVAMNSSGQLGTVGSSRRFKKDIKVMEQASETILSLKPVTFHYRKEIDPEGLPQYGLVAEEVEKINPDLVVRDKEGKPYTVRYDAVNAMLLNEFLKAHRKMEEQEKEIDELKTQLKQQAAVIQGVTDRLEIRAATSLAVNREP